MSALQLNQQMIHKLVEQLLSQDSLKLNDGSIEALQGFQTIEQIAQWCDSNGLASDIFDRLVAETLEVPWVERIGELNPSVKFVEEFPIGLAREHQVMGFETQGDGIRVAMGSWTSLSQLDVLSRFFDCPIEPFLAQAVQVESVINQAYERRNSQTVATIESLDTREAILSLNQASEREDLLDSSGRSPVIRLVNSVFFDAVLSRASDIHFQPTEHDLSVRFRIDGVLFDQFRIPKTPQEEVLSRIKIIGEMNIAEKRLPQDGRASVQIGDRLIDLRIASLPTSFGERIVVRLLDKSARLYTLEELGMPKRLLKEFRSLLHLEHGLILVTGPTGSGKSTTLYAGLQEINTNYSNIVTLEDPIEYQLGGISQTQISEKKGLTFADGLRSVLRQDPDVIMVGEIRDEETANMAIQSALTGHMVFSTLHTNDAPSAVTRLLDLGVEPYLVSSSLLGVLAQRLVRRICPDCIETIENPMEELRRLGIQGKDAQPPQQGKGCASCRETGYQGRVGLFEFMKVDDDVRNLIQQQSNASQIREAARSNGMKLLREDGLGKILEGRTTVDEVIRVSMESS